MQRTKNDKRKEQKLKPQHQIFVEEIAKGKPQSVAYRQAFPNVKNRNTAEAAASRLLRNVNISEAVQNRIQRALNNCQVTVEEVIGGSARQMRSSIDDVLDESGSFDIEKARKTGAIDFVKSHTETITYRKNGDIVKTVNVDLLTNQDGRREIAGYMEKNKTNPDTTRRAANAILHVLKMHPDAPVEYVIERVCADTGTRIEDVIKLLNL